MQSYFANIANGIKLYLLWDAFQNFFLAILRLRKETKETVIVASKIDERINWRTTYWMMPKTAAMLVYQINPLGAELFFYVRTFFCFSKFAFENAPTTGQAFRNRCG